MASPMAWQYCGNQIKLWRTRAGVSRDELAKEAGYEYETIKSMEQGRRKPTLRLLQIADQLCGAGELLVAAQAYLKPERFVSYSQDFMLLEADAIALSSYESQLIPGLLQTEETMRLLINGHWPPLDDETVEERVAARLARQAMLDKATKMFNFIVGEEALCGVLGNMEAHKRQLLHLVSAGERRNVTVQVLRAGGVHPGLDGPFVLLEMPEHERFVYEEGQQSGVLYSEPEKVAVMSQRHVVIAQRALSPDESACFLRKLVNDL
ncbi:helix-turn-helix transcriptional regulator [Streptomyces sp. ET3-23]|uniref:helix-turn-helix domain-containing protein n=1 Tax=Streptomyces sp. ET3-23 TaxID=2885643 RepID=UPI001D1290C5|nr:helix-turn-helix transcriptional regulator [Streptomyces sp. ET3-23]MCC2274637.1 helix-turn-helix transcriptional regulator [Streptomyces sp. ET3-23]